LGKGRRPQKASTIEIDRSRIKRHIIPLLGARRVKDLAATDIVKFIRDVASGKTKLDVKTKARGRAIVRGGSGTAARAVACSVVSSATPARMASSTKIRSTAFGSRPTR
jgi:hypothetical protein